MLFGRLKEKKSNEDLYIICGLGNPGLNYERTRHNCGFMVVDALAQKYKGNWKSTRFEAETCRISIAGEKVLLVKPQTFMNLSGVALGQILRYYRAELSKTLVIYDDIDIALSSIRIREKGGAGSHNGMKSILQHMKSQDFPRIRVGIGPQPPHIDIVDYVLAAFPEEEREKLSQGIENSVAATESFIRDGIQTAMNRFNKNSK